MIDALQVGHDDKHVLISITPEGSEKATVAAMTPEQVEEFVNVIAHAMWNLGQRHRLFGDMADAIRDVDPDDSDGVRR